MTRSYSVVESEGRGERLTMSVLLTSNSRGGSKYMHGLRVGDKVVVSRPLQDFPLSLGAPRYVLVAGGIGVTAILPMAELLRRVGANYTVVYAGRSRERMAYLAQLEHAHGDRLEVRISEEGRRIEPAAVVQQLADGQDRSAVEMYACGPHPLLDDVRRCWADAHLPPTNLRFETFGGAGGRQSPPFVVRFAGSSRETVVGPEETLLDALERSGVPVMYDCLKGECGLCVLPVSDVEGVTDHRDVFLSERQRAEGALICACVSRVMPGPSSAATLTLD